MVQEIVALLQDHPHPLSAKAITRFLREKLQIPDLKKNQVNSVLYSNPALFIVEKGNPPFWSLRSIPAKEAGSTPRPLPSRIGENNNATLSPRNREFAESRDNESFSGASVVHMDLPGFDEVPGRNLPPPPWIPDRFTSPVRPLFPWQVQALQVWRSSGGRGVVEAVTGSGKSMVAIQLLYHFIKARKRSLILVPSTALQEQWHREIKAHLGFDTVSHIGGGPGYRYRQQSPITIGIVNSVAQNAPLYTGHFDLIIADETHRYGASFFRRALLDTASFRMGLTATFERSDDGVGEVLKPYFNETICLVYDFQRARKENVVARYGAVFIGVDLDPQEQKQYQEFGTVMTKKRNYLKNNWPDKYDGVSFGEFLAQAVLASQKSDGEGLAARGYIHAMTQRRKILSESTVKTRCAETLAPAARTANKFVFFCETQIAAESIANRLQASGLLVAAHHSGIPDQERSGILDGLKHGGLHGVVAVHTLDEGVDVPNLDLGVVVAGTKQRRQMIQRMGRVLRKKPDGRKAVFVVIYAKGTAEDPGLGINCEESHFDVLIQNADRKEFLDATTMPPGELGPRVAAFVAEHVGVPT